MTERIARFEQESAENQIWLAPYVRQFNILPLWSAWFETVGIRPDGSIRKFSADGDHVEYEGLRLVEERPVVVFSLLEGAKRYPCLQQVVPQRPVDAVTCERCGGNGLGANIICVCGGIGWLTGSAT
ncbi:MAG: hypothetical protein JSR34_07050 [Proteobacteria bacterium]|nr:hypothetical protein [Pseudomonadota bacterium]